MENVNKLPKLTILDLAINQIHTIEGLEFIDQDSVNEKGESIIHPNTVLTDLWLN